LNQLWTDAWNAISGGKVNVTKEDFIAYCRKVETDENLFEQQVQTWTKDYFNLLDQDGDKKISREEFHNVLSRLGLSDAQRVENYFKALDADNSGYISFDELLTATRESWRPSSLESYKKFTGQ
jgi:Ca2+-binding EF-hand superfamily protein